MSKESEALEKVRNCLYPFASDNQKAFDIIETALKEKENIEKTINELFSDNGKVITTIDIKKQLKALKIIKEKPVVALVDYKYTYEEWLELVDEKDKDLFKNKEEYDL